MAITLSSTFSAALTAHSGTTVVDQIALGSIKLYDGTGGAPAGANESITTQVLLATWTLPANTVITEALGVITLNIVTMTVTAAASGTALFFRICNSGGTSLIQGSVATSAADFNLSSTVVTSGDNVALTGTPTITMPVT